MTSGPVARGQLNGASQRFDAGGPPGTASSRFRWVTAASAALAAGSAIMAVAHSGVEIPVISTLGPGGSRAVVPAAIAFTGGAALHGAVALGAAGYRRWAAGAGAVLGAVTLMAAAQPFRGVGSVVGIVLAAAQAASSIAALRSTRR